MSSLSDCMDVHLKRNKQDENYKVDGYPHPYRFEIEKFEPLTKQLEVTQETIYKSLENTPLKWVCGREDFRVLIDKLSKESEIAIDLENHSFRSYQGFVCLMQVSTRNEDFLIDTLELRSEMYQLNKVFTNPNIVKVFHGADMDIQWLQRDFGVYIVNLFDTGQASRVLDFPKFSLAYLLKHYCNVDADKKYQLADWRIRPLPEEMVKYAREDTHYLLYIYDRLRKEAIQRSNENKNILREIIRRSKEVSLLKYHKEICNEDTFNSFYQKSNQQLTSKQLTALKKIYFWRDNVARREDESLRYVIPNHMLLTIARDLPKDVENLLAMCVPTPALLRIYSHEIVNLIQDGSSLNDSFVQPQPEEDTKGYFDSPVPDEKSLFEQIGWNIPSHKSDYKPPDLVKITDFDDKNHSVGLFRFDNHEQPPEELKTIINQINSSFDPSFSIRAIDFDDPETENIEKVLKPLDPNEFEKLSPPKKDVIPKSMAEIYKRANEIKNNLDKKANNEPVKTENTVYSPLDLNKYESNNDEDSNKKRKRLEELNNDDPNKKNLPVKNFMQEIGWVKEHKPKIIIINKEKKDTPTFDYSSVNSNLGNFDQSNSHSRNKHEFTVKAPKGQNKKPQFFKRGGKISSYNNN